VLPELSELKIARKKLGITQSELASKTTISQSLIAKIEAGTMVPSYSNAKKLFDFFDSLSEKTQAKARDFMSLQVISTTPKSSLQQAVKIMKKNAVSQLPVLEGEKNCGTISEKTVLELLNSAKDLNAVSSMRVEEVMTEAMPIIKEDSPFKVISALLEHNPGVIVARAGKISGIITKSDLLSAVLGAKAKTVQDNKL